MEERLHQQHGTGRQDPLTPGPSSGDQVGRWAEELRGAFVADLDPGQVTQMASLASSAAAVGAASIATAAGVTAGAAVTGGKTMTGLFASTMTKLVVAGSLVATLGGGTAAVTGNLPAPLQNGAAGAASFIGIDLPKADLAIDANGAGKVVIEVVDDTLGIVGIDANTGWTAEIRSQTDTEVIVDFVSETSTKTVTAVKDAAGEITSNVEVSGSAKSEYNAQLNSETEMSDDQGSPSGAVDGEFEGDLETDLNTGLGSGSVDVEIGGNAGLGLNN